MAKVANDFRRRDLIHLHLLPGLAVCAALLAAPGPALAVEPAGKPETAAVGADFARPPQGIADLKALEQKIQTTVARATPSVVSVSGGSGVVISSEGYVLTVAHVGRQAGRPVVVIFPDGRRAQAVTLGNDHGVDAGMLKITDRGPWPAVEMGSAADLKPGQWCLTLGYPITFEHGKKPLVRVARVLMSRTAQVITDGAIMGGDSGAPLFSLDGKVIAIGSKCDNNSLAWNIHVPIDRFREGWESLAAGKDFNSLAPLLEFFAAEDADDARIDSIAAGSGAEKAGLRPGDLVLKFDGQAIRHFEELPRLLQQHKPGDQVEIEIRRGGETSTLQLPLGQSNTRKEP